jgi:hypothetical protein
LDVTSVNKVIFSVAEMQEKGNIVSFMPGRCTVRGPSGNTIEAVRFGKLFYLPFEIIKNESLIAPVLEEDQFDAAMAPFEQDDEENDFEYERNDDELEVQGDPDRNINDAVPEAPETSGLRAPRLPSFAEQEQHRLHHEPFAAWCEDCVQGRAHALPHRSVRAADRVEKSERVVQVDYQF